MSIAYLNLEWGGLAEVAHLYCVDTWVCVGSYVTNDQL